MKLITEDEINRFIAEKGITKQYGNMTQDEKNTVLWGYNYEYETDGVRVLIDNPTRK